MAGQKCLAEKVVGLSVHHSLFWQEGVFIFRLKPFRPKKPESLKLGTSSRCVTVPQLTPEPSVHLKGRDFDIWMEVWVLRLPLGTCCCCFNSEISG